MANFWNIKNEKIVYFHVCRPEDSFYLKVDTFNQIVWKLNPENLNMRGTAYLKGVHEIRWSTFISNYACQLTYKSLKWTEHCEQLDGKYRGRIKYTTETQFTDQLRKLLIQITKT